MSESWRDEALCAQTDPDLFFPEAWQTGLMAKRICQQCPVTDQCLSYAFANNEREGVWGGMTSYDRARLLREARKAS